MNRPILTQSQPNDSEDKPATSSGPQSNLGRRKAYEDLCKAQWNMFSMCKITLFSLLSSYTLRKKNAKQKVALGAPTLLLEIDNHGKNFMFYINAQYILYLRLKILFIVIVTFIIKNRSDYQRTTAIYSK